MYESKFKKKKKRKLIKYSYKNKNMYKQGNVLTIFGKVLQVTTIRFDRLQSSIRLQINNKK